MSQISQQQMIECVTREIGMRERVYPRWVEQKKMSQQKSDHEIAAMKAVLATLVGMQATQSLPDPLSQSLNEGNGVYRP